MSKSLFIL